MADAIAGLLDDHHGTVIEVSDALSGPFAGLDNLELQALAGQEDGLEGVGQVVDVYDLYAAKASDFVEVVVVGYNPGVESFGGCDEHLINGAAEVCGEIHIAYD